jgi:hypothetical protein
MKAKQLKELLSKTDDNAEIVVHADSNSRDYKVWTCRLSPLSSRYFGGDVSNDTSDCLVLDTD